MNPDRPVSTAWIINRTGAKNKNEYSIGSVIPVKNETRADPANTAATLRF